MKLLRGKKMKILIGLLMICFCFTACTKAKVSFDTAEDARKQVRENTTILAQTFRAENKLADYDIYIRGDSTVSQDCPQGDGWSSIDLTQRSSGTSIKLKCSTVSAGIGCMTEEDFKGKRYAQEEGRCSSDIPFPLPKIVK